MEICSRLDVVYFIKIVHTENAQTIIGHWLHVYRVNKHDFELRGQEVNFELIGNVVDGPEEIFLDDIDVRIKSFQE